MTEKTCDCQTKTIPWVDALHKMGRQILNLLTLAAVFTLLMFDKNLTGPAIAALLGGNGIYQYVKGKGSQ